MQRRLPIKQEEITNITQNATIRSNLALWRIGIVAINATVGDKLSPTLCIKKKTSDDFHRISRQIGFKILNSDDFLLKIRQKPRRLSRLGQTTTGRMSSGGSRAATGEIGCPAGANDDRPAISSIRSGTTKAPPRGRGLGVGLRDSAQWARARLVAGK